MCGLKQYTQRIVLSVLLQVRRANSDGREHNRYRKSNLSQIDEKPQIHTTYGWTRPITHDMGASRHTTHACQKQPNSWFRHLSVSTQ